MKKLLTTNISPTVGMPLKSGSIDHMISSWQEMSVATARTAIDRQGKSFNTSSYYVLYGVQNSGAAGTFTISAGAILFNDEVYLVDAVANFTPGMGQTCVGVLDVTYFTATNADMVQHTDGNNYNVHAIRKIKFQAGVSGSGLVDFANLVQTGLESKHIVGATGEPAFQNGWTNLNAGVDEPAFRKDFSKNIVFLSGTPDKLLYTGAAEIVFTLPTGYRPPTRVIFVVPDAATANGENIVVSIQTNGNVEFDANTIFAATTVSVTLNGMFFFLD